MKFHVTGDYAIPRILMPFELFFISNKKEMIYLIFYHKQNISFFPLIVECE